jgi:hypothetical protein
MESLVLILDVTFFAVLTNIVIITNLADILGFRWRLKGINFCMNVFTWTLLLAPLPSVLL